MTADITNISSRLRIVAPGLAVDLVFVAFLEMKLTISSSRSELALMVSGRTKDDTPTELSVWDEDSNYFLNLSTYAVSRRSPVVSVSFISSRSTTVYRPTQLEVGALGTLTPRLRC